MRFALQCLLVDELCVRVHVAVKLCGLIQHTQFMWNLYTMDVEIVKKNFKKPE